MCDDLLAGDQQIQLTRAEIGDTIRSTVTAPNASWTSARVGCCGGQNADFGYLNAGGVDLCDACNDYTAGTQPMPPWGASHLWQCLAHGKPSFVGEAGICAFIHAEGDCVTPTTAAILGRAGQ